MRGQAKKGITATRIRHGALIACLVAVVSAWALHASAQSRSAALPTIVYMRADRADQWDFGGGSLNEKPACSTAQGLRVQGAQRGPLLGYLGDVTRGNDALVAYVQQSVGRFPVYGAAPSGERNGSHWGILMVGTAAGCFVVYQEAP
jgi:hypothetical protein